MWKTFRAKPDRARRKVESLLTLVFLPALYIAWFRVPQQ
jgi:hypothetical protein